MGFGVSPWEGLRGVGLRVHCSHLQGLSAAVQGARSLEFTGAAVF